jgi:large subunit ribosomal protein L1
MAEAKKTTKKVAEKKPAKAKKAELIAETVAEDNVPEVIVETEVVETAEPAAEEGADKPLAKAGKRSAKAAKETEQKQAKAERKQSGAATEAAPKPAKNPTRPKAERAGKKYKQAFKLVDKDKVYSLNDALELATKTSTTKFDATVELHVNLGVDPKQADQNVRDTVALPAGTGKTVRIAVFTEEAGVKEAKAAGADIAGSDDFLAQLDKEQLDFDVLIANPQVMAKLGKYARLLGPRGLMPNPKSGTVTTDIAKAIVEAKGGRVEYRVDQAGIIHMGIGKVSFGGQKLQDNANAAIASIKAAKPASLKAPYVKSAYITTSMGPSIKVEI